jgi:hypothetical protein
LQGRILDGLIHEDYARKPAFIPPDQADDPVFKMYVQNRFKDDMEYHQFRRKVRVVAKEAGLPWRPSDLNDACDQWYDEQRRDRLWRLFEEIEYSGSLLTRQKGEDALRLLAPPSIRRSPGRRSRVCAGNPTSRRYRTGSSWPSGRVRSNSSCGRAGRSTPW